MEPSSTGCITRKGATRAHCAGECRVRAGKRQAARECLADEVAARDGFHGERVGLCVLAGE